MFKTHNRHIQLKLKIPPCISSQIIMLSINSIFHPKNQESRTYTYNYTQNLEVVYESLTNVMLCKCLHHWKCDDIQVMAIFLQSDVNSYKKSNQNVTTKPKHVRLSDMAMFYSLQTLLATCCEMKRFKSSRNSTKFNIFKK